MPPFFSIILPTYNRATFLPKAINSVLLQKFQDFELVIIDDASTDNTEETVQQFNDARIIYLKNEKNIERSASRNKGIDHAKGQYICFLDSDDYYLENYLNILNNEIIKLNFPLSMFYTRLFCKKGDILQEYHIPPIGKQHPVEYMLYHALNTGICVPASILKANKFNEKLIFCEDLDLWTRVLTKIKLKLIPEFTGVYVTAEYNSTNRNQRNLAKEQIKSLKKIFSNKEITKFINFKTKRKMLSEKYFLQAFYFYEKNQFFNLIYSIFMSLFLFPTSYQFMLKINMLITMLPFVKKKIKVH